MGAERTLFCAVTKTGKTRRRIRSSRRRAARALGVGFERLAAQCIVHSVPDLLQGQMPAPHDRRNTRHDHRCQPAFRMFRRADLPVTAHWLAAPGGPALVGPSDPWTRPTHRRSGRAAHAVVDRDPSRTPVRLCPGLPGARLATDPSPTSPGRHPGHRRLYRGGCDARARPRQRISASAR